MGVPVHVRPLLRKGRALPCLARLQVGSAPGETERTTGGDLDPVASGELTGRGHPPVVVSASGRALHPAVASVVVVAMRVKNPPY